MRWLIHERRDIAAMTVTIYHNPNLGTRLCRPKESVLDILPD